MNKSLESLVKSPESSQFKTITSKHRSSEFKREGLFKTSSQLQVRGTFGENESRYRAISAKVK